MKKVILITGISSGFGKETAELLAQKGHIVYGTVRKKTETKSHIHILLMDLLSPDSISEAVQTVVHNEGRIDVLINNAGMHTGGSIETLPLEFVKMQMDTNFMGLVHLTRKVLTFMRKQGGGTIINFGSIGGLMGLPFQGYYSASKFAIEGFSEALRMEVKQFKINVVVINPGDFSTNNSANRRNFIIKSESDPYQPQFEKTLSIIENDETKGWIPSILAKKLVKIVECRNPRQRYIIASPEQKLAVVLKNILPGKIFGKILESHYGIK
ncbi:MAG TPA: SDR family oxidoreductase [Draconibacterium sp.]|nr:SDR family oxidoreductase [Draconibacterium sp.]